MLPFAPRGLTSTRTPHGVRGTFRLSPRSQSQPASACWCLAWYFNIKHPYTGIHTPLVAMLRRHALEHGRRWYVAGELQVSMRREEAPRELDLAPDMLVAMAEGAERSPWNVRLEGAPLALVLEVVTDESWDRDTDEKPALYDALGVAEYVISPPQRRDGGPALFGYGCDPRDGWVPWRADGEGRLRSEMLEGLRLYPEGNRLLLLDPAGLPLPTEEELL